VARLGHPGKGGGRVKTVVAYIDGRKRLDGVITLDNTTLGEYVAEDSSSDRIDAVIAALSGTVSVKVYDGSGVEKASGTLGSPWATNVSGQLVVGALSSFSVTGAGTPDAGWYLRFESGARWVRGSFGLKGSGQEFTWSQSTWAVGHTGRIGTVVMLAPTNAAPSWSGAPSTLSLYAGQTYNFAQHASDPNGDPLTFTLAAGSGDGYSLTSAGVLTIGSVSKSVTVRASDGVLTADHVCACEIPVAGNILWDGSFDGGNVRYADTSLVAVPSGRFRLWHERTTGQENLPRYWGIPQYGRPAQQAGDYTVSGYYGNGELLELVTSPVRAGTCAAKFRVKNSTAEQDYDVGPVSSRRRTELWMHQTLPFNGYGGIVERQTFWASVSYYFPTGFWPAAGSGWGPIVFQIKTLTGRNQPVFSIQCNYSGGAYRWQLRNSWYPYSTNDVGDSTTIPWWYQMYYDYQFPATGSSWSSCVADFVDGNSRAALSEFALDTWTDWVFQFRPDGRGAGEGGAGFMKAWKRQGSGAWKPILHITPKITSAGGNTFDHGIFRRADGGYGPLAGIYCEASQVVGVGERQVVIDNVKVGNSACTFSQMSPDGSAP
jgi:hypothetical protein